MSEYLRNNEEIIIQGIKKANCLKTKLGKDHTIFSIVDKKLRIGIASRKEHLI